MRAIFKREFNAYFTSPVGFVFLAAFLALSGFFFYSQVLAANTAELTGVFSAMFLLLLILIPILTMRLLSEERRQKTDQALLTSPVSLTAIVAGKFLAAFCMLLLALSVTFLYAITVGIYAAPDWMVFFGNVTGAALLGGALIAVGLLVSALTESQVVSAVGSFAAILLLFLIDTMADAVPFAAARTALRALSLLNRFSSFTAGMFSISSALYFLSLIAVFLFLSVRVLEKRRWS